MKSERLLTIVVSDRELIKHGGETARPSRHPEPRYSAKHTVKETHP